MQHNIFTNRNELLQEVIAQVKSSITAKKYSIRTLATHTEVSKTIIGYLNQGKANKASLESLMKVSNFLGIKYNFSNSDFEENTPTPNKHTPKFKLNISPAKYNIEDSVWRRFKESLTEYVNQGLRAFFRHDKKQTDRLEKKYYANKLNKKEEEQFLEHYTNIAHEHDMMVKILSDELKRTKAERKKAVKMFERLSQEANERNNFKNMSF